MAFVLKDFQPVGGSARSGSPSLNDDGSVFAPPGSNAKAYWVYGSTDAIATQASPGYFNEVRDLVNTNDALLFASETGENLAWSSFLVVPKSPLKTDVTVSALNQLAS